MKVKFHLLLVQPNLLKPVKSDDPKTMIHIVDGHREAERVQNLIIFLLDSL